MIKKIGIEKIVLILMLWSPVMHAHKMVCFKMGTPISPAEQAQLNCLYHTMIIANGDPAALETDTQLQQQGVYLCYINFDVSHFKDGPILLVDQNQATLLEPDNLLAAHSFRTFDNRLINAYVYFSSLYRVTDPRSGEKISMLSVLKQSELLTTDIANALGIKSTVYSKYSPLVPLNLGPEISGVFSPLGFIRGCKISY